MTASAKRIVACIVLLVLPLQALALAMDRMWGPAHFHPNAASVDVNDLAVVETCLPGRSDRKHLDEHHRSVVGHHHHEAHDAVVYVGDADDQHDPQKVDRLKRVHGGLELIAASVRVAADTGGETADLAAGPHRFCSHVCSPPERPPR